MVRNCGVVVAAAFWEGDVQQAKPCYNSHLTIPIPVNGPDRIHCEFCREGIDLNISETVIQLTTL
jgi:hypothetical protein